MSAKHIVQLDGIRGAAILLVLIGHYFANSYPAFWPDIINRLTWTCWIGVDLFFVLSGFLITGILIDEKGAGNFLRVFYARRAFRILPPYLLTLVLWAVCNYFIGFSFRFGWLFYHQLPGWQYATFFQNVFMARQNSLGGAFLAITWSLGVEEQFYLCLPWIVLLCRSRRQLLYVCLPLILVAPILRSLDPASVASVALLQCRMDGLLIGAVLAILAREPSAVDLLSRKALRPMMLLLAPIALYLTYAERDNPLTHTVVCLWFGAVLLHSVLEPEKLTGRFFSWKWLRWFGRISYGLYLYHEAIRGLLFGWLLGCEPALKTASEWGVNLLALAASIALAALSFYFYERFFIGLGKKYRYG